MTALGDHHAKFAFVVNALGNGWSAEYRVRGLAGKRRLEKK